MKTVVQLSSTDLAPRSSQGRAGKNALLEQLLRRQSHITAKRIAEHSHSLYKLYPD
jgi:hypothetical protein